jgi:hypothetical protein
MARDLSSRLSESTWKAAIGAPSRLYITKMLERSQLSFRAAAEQALGADSPVSNLTLVSGFRRLPALG